MVKAPDFCSGDNQEDLLDTLFESRRTQFFFQTFNFFFCLTLLIFLFLVSAFKDHDTSRYILCWLMLLYSLGLL